MPRTFSTTMTEALAAQETGEGEVVLLTVEHTDWSSPEYLVNADQAITSNGTTFQAFAFKAELPEQSDRVRQASLTLDNADRRLVQVLRDVQSPATVTMQAVLFSDPDTVELEGGPLRVEKADIGLQQISIKLGGEPVAYAQFPPNRATPEVFPANF